MRKFSYVSNPNSDGSNDDEEYNISDEFDEQVSHQVGTGYSMRSVRNTRGSFVPSVKNNSSVNDRNLNK